LFGQGYDDKQCGSRKLAVDSIKISVFLLFAVFLCKAKKCFINGGNYMKWDLREKSKM
jgi:hypothetical protein